MLCVKAIQLIIPHRLNFQVNSVNLMSQQRPFSFNHHPKLSNVPNISSAYFVKVRDALAESLPRNARRS